MCITEKAKCLYNINSKSLIFLELRVKSATDVISIGITNATQSWILTVFTTITVSGRGFPERILIALALLSITKP